MELLKEMELNLIQLWHQAIRAASVDRKAKLMRDYRLAYSRYKKQERFAEAMEASVNAPNKILQH